MPRPRRHQHEGRRGNLPDQYRGHDRAREALFPAAERRRRCRRRRPSQTETNPLSPSPRRPRSPSRTSSAATSSLTRRRSLPTFVSSSCRPCSPSLTRRPPTSSLPPLLLILAILHLQKGSAAMLDYSATKGSIATFTRSLATQQLEKGIRVVAVAPGPVYTPLQPASRPAEQMEGWSVGSVRLAVSLPSHRRRFALAKLPALTSSALSLAVLAHPRPRRPARRARRVIRLPRDVEPVDRHDRPPVRPPPPSSPSPRPPSSPSLTPCSFPPSATVDSS